MRHTHTHTHTYRNYDDIYRVESEVLRVFAEDRGNKKHKVSNGANTSALAQLSQQIIKQIS